MPAILCSPTTLSRCPEMPSQACGRMVCRDVHGRIDVARAIVEFRGDDEMARRLEELAAKCNEGELTNKSAPNTKVMPTRTDSLR
jgi:hypothetical protein